MRRINTMVALALILGPMASFAEDKPAPRSLAEEAAYLSEKSGKLGWVSEEVTVSMDGGRKGAKGKLLMRFQADKGKPAGGLLLGVDYTYGSTAVGKPVKFELVEKDGKRSIRIIDGTETKTLEYSVDADKLTVKGGVIRKSWEGWDVDLTKPTSFKAAAK
jgi:hypothetical protein